MKTLDIENPVGADTQSGSFTVSEPILPETGSPLLSIVIPAYNERERIGRTLCDYARTLKGISHEILVAVDGSNDGTADAVRAISDDLPSVKVAEHRRRLGKGGGILAGIRQVQGDWIAIVDADGSLPPEELSRIFAMVSSNDPDGIVGTRYWNRHRVLADYGFLRWLASRAFNLLVRSLFRLPYRDTQCGAKVIRRNAMEAVASKIRLRRYAFDVELLWRLSEEGYDVWEVPIEWGHRDGSKIRIFSTSSRMFFDLFRLLLGR